MLEGVSIVGTLAHRVDIGQDIAFLVEVRIIEYLGLVEESHGTTNVDMGLGIVEIA